MTRVLGLDVGARRVGVAVSDPLGLSAQPVGFIRRASRRDDMEKVGEFVLEYEVGLVVVGLPRNMDGSEGRACEEARLFASWVERDLGVAVEMQDERLTTVGAERLLLEADVSRARRRRVVDKMAASLMLQTYMDSRRRGGDEPGEDG